MSGTTGTFGRQLQMARVARGTRTSTSMATPTRPTTTIGTTVTLFVAWPVQSPVQNPSLAAAVAQRGLTISLFQISLPPDFPLLAISASSGDILIIPTHSIKNPPHHFFTIIIGEQSVIRPKTHHITLASRSKPISFIC